MRIRNSTRIWLKTSSLIKVILEELGRQHSGRLRFLRPARVRRLSWPDAETKLVRRQGAIGPHLEDGQSIFAEIARRGRACGPLSSQAARRRAAILGKETHADQALQACRRRARQ